ncbi:hypothetical protein FRC03_002885 [Tulasnella sp. 419]|nr:hypothetical protein FRC03_002885 [Tulasnella sp. 419]
MHPLIKMFANRDVNKAWSVYQSLIQGCEGPNRWCSPVKPQGVEEENNSLVYMGEFLWSSFISGFARCHRLELAEQVWMDMDRFNVVRTPTIYNAMIDAYGKRGDVENAQEIWDQIAPESRDVYTYTTMMSALFQTHHPVEGLVMFEEMKLQFGEGMVNGRLTTRGLTPIACNAVIHGLLICNRPEVADSILDMMRTDGPKPDTVTYNTFLRNYEIKNNMVAFQATLRSIAQEGLQPDVFTYTTILDLLLRTNKENTVGRLFDIMSEMNVNPNEATYTTIVDSLMRRKGKRNIQLALDLAEKMEQEGVQTNEVTYTSIVAGIRRDDTLAPEVSRRLFEEVLNRMRARGMEPNRVTYNFLIEACLQRGGPDGVEEAMMWFRSIGKDWVSYETYVVTLRGMMASGRMDHVQEVLDKIRESGFQPRGALKTLVDNAIRKLQLRQSY